MYVWHLKNDHGAVLLVWFKKYLVATHDNHV